jgi:hypothetical protein
MEKPMSNDVYAHNEQPTDLDLKRISNLAELYVQTYQNIIQTERELETMKKAFEEISTDQLPAAMNAVNMREFVLRNGYRLAVEEVFNVRLPKNKIDKADEWLDKNGHGGMIKRKLQIDIDDEIPEAVLDRLKTEIEKEGYTYEEVKTVHWATIQSWATEMKNGGEIIPEDIFTVFRGNRTVITE